MNSTMKMLAKTNLTLKNILNNNLLKSYYTVSLDLIERYKDNIEDFYDTHINQRIAYEIGKAVHKNKKVETEIKESEDGNFLEHNSLVYVFSPTEFDNLISEIFKSIEKIELDKRLYKLMEKRNED